MADPIAALKALVDISKLRSGEDAAVEYLSKEMFARATVLSVFASISDGPIFSKDDWLKPG